MFYFKAKKNKKKIGIYQIEHNQWQDLVAGKVIIILLRLINDKF